MTRSRVAAIHCTEAALRTVVNGVHLVDLAI